MCNGSMVTHTRLRYTRDYLTPGICSLIKPAAIEKIDATSCQSPHSHVMICIKTHLIVKLDVLFRAFYAVPIVAKHIKVNRDLWMIYA